MVIKVEWPWIYIICICSIWNSSKTRDNRKSRKNYEYKCIWQKTCKSKAVKRVQSVCVGVLSVCSLCFSANAFGIGMVTWALFGGIMIEFSEITWVLDQIRIEDIESFRSSGSRLFFGCICSVEIRSSLEVIWHVLIEHQLMTPNWKRWASPAAPRSTRLFSNSTFSSLFRVSSNFNKKRPNLTKNRFNLRKSLVLVRIRTARIESFCSLDSGLFLVFICSVGILSLYFKKF